MTQSNNVTIIVVVLAVFVGILLVMVIRLLLLMQKLQSSFGKLGFVVREDAKKYFDDASIKLVDTNEKFRDEYKNIVQQGTQAAIVDIGTVMEKLLADAQSNAGDVILQARQNAQQIVDAAKDQAREQFYQSINRSVEAIDWTLTQYVDSSLSIEQHRDVVEKLLKAYIDENRH